MLTKQEIVEARKLLQNANNPIYLFDDDPDGLAAFLVLRKKFGKGAGIVIKTSPNLDASYLDKVNEYNPDLVVILDKPLVDKEFFDGISVPIMWVDHHPAVKAPKNVHYFNPIVHDSNDNRPTSYQAYLISGEKSWIALLGCVSDWYLPEFYSDFVKLYPDILQETKNVEKVLFEMKFGEIVKTALFSLKGKSSDIKKNISALLSIESPYELLNGTTEIGRFLIERTEKSKKEYNELLAKAVKEAGNDKLLIFIYPANKNSYTGELSNELFYRFPDRLIIVGREKNNEIKMSFRCNKLKLPSLIEKALVGVRGYGGGHDSASGGAVNSRDFELFIKNIREEIKNKL